ncbi:unnamed protein product [Orchesella dallaii]|uniref:Uncharacterized protein n=1 Tax=Orchesella dallaii TaxID=48710 RepID=A0ABP1PTG0_9HEXA
MDNFQILVYIIATASWISAGPVPATPAGALGEVSKREIPHVNAEGNGDLMSLLGLIADPNVEDTSSFDDGLRMKRSVPKPNSTDEHSNAINNQTLSNPTEHNTTTNSHQHTTPKPTTLKHTTTHRLTTTHSNSITTHQATAAHTTTHRPTTTHHSITAHTTTYRPTTAHTTTHLSTTAHTTTYRPTTAHTTTHHSTTAHTTTYRPTTTHRPTTAHPSQHISPATSHNKTGITGRSMASPPPPPSKHSSSNKKTTKKPQVGTQINASTKGHSEHDLSLTTKAVGITGRTLELPVITNTTQKSYTSNATTHLQGQDIKNMSTVQDKKLNQQRRSETKEHSPLAEVNVASPLNNYTKFLNENISISQQTSGNISHPTNLSYGQRTPVKSMSLWHRVKLVAQQQNVSHCPEVEDLIEGSHTVKAEIGEADTLHEDLTALIDAAGKSLKSAKNCVHRMVAEIRIALSLKSEDLKTKKEEQNEKHLLHPSNNTTKAKPAKGASLSAKMKKTALEAEKILFPINLMTG